MYELTLRATSALLIGGQSSSLTVNKVTARDGSDQPYIPASAIKGAMRIEFERLLRGAELKGVRVCAVTDDDSACSLDKEPCLACALFGGRDRSGKLRFYDAYLHEGTDSTANYETRTGVSISRKTRTAEPQRLYDFQTTARDLAFTTRITTLSELEPQEAQYFKQALDWWAEMGLRLGGNRSRGLGWLEVEYVPEEDDVSVSPATLTGNTEQALYEVTYTPAEPVRVSPETPRNYHRETLDFIPGSTLAGAIAYGLLRGGISDDTVQTLFADRPIAISHLYAGGLTQIRPATTRRCKKVRSHGLYDVLPSFYLLKLMVQQQPPMPETFEELRKHAERCPKCDSPFKPVNPLEDPDRRLYTKLGMSRKLMRAEEGLFYIYETLEESDNGAAPQFQGLMYADEDQFGQIRQLDNVLVGGARSKGFGEGQLEIRRYDASELASESDLSSRLTEFNTTLKDLAESCEMTEPLGARLYFSLTLLTDLLPPPNTTLAELLEPYGWKCELTVVRWTRLGGYSEATSQSKPLLPALARGGVILLSSEQQADELTPQLARLERQGLGLERHQGFGWLRACHQHPNVEVPSW